MPSLTSSRRSMAKSPAITIPNTHSSSPLPPSHIRALYKRIKLSVKPNKAISPSSSAALSDYVIVEPHTSQEHGFLTLVSGSSYSVSDTPTTALPSGSPKPNPGWLSPSESASSDLDTLASGDARPLGDNTEPTDASSSTATSEASLFAVTYASEQLSITKNFKEALWWKTSPASSLTAIDVETYIKGANKDGLNNVSHEITSSSSSLIEDTTNQLLSNAAEDDVALGRIVHSFSKASGLAGDTDDEDDHDTGLQLLQGSSPARKANEAMMAAMCAEIDDLLNHEESVQDISVELNRGSSPVRRANEAVVAAMIDDLDTFMGELTATNEAPLSTFEIFELVSVEPVTVLGLVEADIIDHINDNQADHPHLQSAFVDVYLHWPGLTNVLHLRVHINATLNQFSTAIHNYFDYMGSCIIHLGSADNGIVMATSRLFEFWLAHASGDAIMEAWVLDDKDEAVSLAARTEGNNGGNHVNLPRSPTWTLFQEQDLDINQHAEATASVVSQEEEDYSSWDFAMTRQEVQQDLAALVPTGDTALWKSLRSKAVAGAKLAKHILIL